ncbi:MAG: MarR family winged helix-turn-helix transcriptional regulator [Bacteroidia bacterium]
MNKEINTKHKHETVCSTFRSSWLQIARMYNMQAESYGGNITIGYFLLNVDGTNGSYATDIAVSLGVGNTGLGRMIKKLEDEKMITRTTDQTDKRKVKIILTAKGKKAKETAKDVVRNFNKELITQIGEKDLNTFFKIAQKVAKVTEQKINNN